MPFVPHRTQVDCGAGRWAARNDPGVCNYVLLAGLFLVIYGVIVPLAGAQLPSPSAASTQVAPQQNVDQSESPATPAFGERINPADERNSSESAVAITAPSGLPSEQIIDILQGNPDVVADLKSMAADRMRTSRRSRWRRGSCSLQRRRLHSGVAAFKRLRFARLRVGCIRPRGQFEVVTRRNADERIDRSAADDPSAHALRSAIDA